MMRVLKLGLGCGRVSRRCRAVNLQSPVVDFIQSVELHDDRHWSCDAAVNFAQELHENLASDAGQGLSVESSRQLMNVKAGTVRSHHAVVKKRVRSFQIILEEVVPQLDADARGGYIQTGGSVVPFEEVMHNTRGPRRPCTRLCELRH